VGGHLENNSSSGASGWEVCMHVALSLSLSLLNDFYGNLVSGRYDVGMHPWRIRSARVRALSLRSPSPLSTHLTDVPQQRACEFAFRHFCDQEGGTLHSLTHSPGLHQKNTLSCVSGSRPFLKTRQRCNGAVVEWQCTARGQSFCSAQGGGRVG
jgi:hypothetical protein